MEDDLLARVEKQRLELEENIAKLKKSLRYWQNLELDYEALKDEVLGLPEDASREECLRKAQDAGVEEVDGKELRELIQMSETRHRRPSQIVEILTRRIEYVSRNIQTLRKQTTDLDKKLNALLLARDPAHHSEAALPLTEITEELDEHGNVVSSKVERPANQISDLTDVLRTAGVDIPDPPEQPGPVDISDDQDMSDNSEPNFEDEAQRTTDFLSGNFEFDETTKMLKPKADIARTDINATPPSAMLPPNPEDNEEEAKLRQEMLQYGLNEVGNIVAELDMAEDNIATDNEDADSYDYSEDEDFEDEDEEDSEDEMGRSKHPNISTKYRKQMEALQTSLGIQNLRSLDDVKNMGPAYDALPSDIRDQLQRSEERQTKPAELARKAAIARHNATKSAPDSSISQRQESKTTSKKSQEKKVAFATELDIAPEKPPASVRQNISPSNQSNIVKEDVLERASPLAPAVPDDSTPSRKPSRFKADRTTNSISTSLPIRPSQDSLTSPSVIERSTPIHPPPAPTSDSGADFDEGLQQRQIAAEFHKLHNKRVHEDGGYVGGGELENYEAEDDRPEVIDERTGVPRRVSLFKARRMGGS